MSLPSRIGDFVRSLSRVQRELAILGIAAFLGFVVMPGLTWLIGIFVFKTYAGGNTVFSLYGNFYQALAKGAATFWIVALGPYALILVARLLVAVARGGSSEKVAEATPAQPKRRPAERRTSSSDARKAPTLESALDEVDPPLRAERTQPDARRAATPTRRTRADANGSAPNRVEPSLEEPVPPAKQAPPAATPAAPRTNRAPTPSGDAARPAAPPSQQATRGLPNGSQTNRAVSAPAAAPSAGRSAPSSPAPRQDPPKPGERRTPFIKSID